MLRRLVAAVRPADDDHRAANGCQAGANGAACWTTSPTANAAGATMTGQVLEPRRPASCSASRSRSIRSLRCPCYQAIAHLPLPNASPRCASRTLRAKHPGRGRRRDPMGTRLRRWDRMFPLGDPPDYEPPAADAASAPAPAQWAPIRAALAYDMLLENDGRAILYRPLQQLRARQSRDGAGDDDASEHDRSGSATAGRMSRAVRRQRADHDADALDARPSGRTVPGGMGGPAPHARQRAGRSGWPIAACWRRG